MGLIDVHSFAAGDWVAPGPGAREIFSAIDGSPIARAGDGALDAEIMLSHARDVGGPALRALGFHDRARMIKALALELGQRKQELYDLSFHTGATQKDHFIDIDGGIGTLFVFASKGRREMPDGDVYLDGPVEQLSKTGTFLGQHIYTPRLGVAVHINAFNFPVWGMLEKLAPSILAGLPCIVKPATSTSYVAEACVRMILETDILPKGALQLVSGGLGDMLTRLGAQDAVSFTGSAATASTLRGIGPIASGETMFIAEQDSLNASILGPDASPGTPEFDLFIKEAHREITTKAGQKCTAIRRIFAPEVSVDAVIDALSARLAATRIGDPRLDTTRMGALVSRDQRSDVLAKAAAIGEEAECVFGAASTPEIEGVDAGSGAFVSPMLFHAKDPDRAERVHDTEAFGPVSTIMGYRDTDHAAHLVNRGGGSLVASIITADAGFARRATLGVAAWHGRVYINNRHSMAESTGHGSPLPHMIHGGPGRAGGGEELGGVRGVLHYMRRTAVQASPDILSAIGGAWVSGAEEVKGPEHPFRRKFADLAIGETIHAGPRTISLEDIEHFAEFTGDTFYAHMDEEAASANPFFPGRVAHGYLLLSFAAGLFVEPAPGPVLANTGLDSLRFMKSVQAGDALNVSLTVKRKTRRTEDYGEVRWRVTLTNQDADAVAEYELLTMNAY